MPPFSRDLMKSMGLHSSFQDGPVIDLNFRQIHKRRISAFLETIKTGWHLQFFTCFQVYDGEVQCAAAVMLGTFARVGNKIGIACLLVKLYRNGVGAVAVEYLQSQ